jgi:hypothetical protein
MSKLLPTGDAFRAILRSAHPEREDLHHIDSNRWFHDRRGKILDRNVIHDQADEPAYEALDLLKAGIAGQKIRLRGSLNGAPHADVDPIDARDGELGVFDETLKIYESKPNFRISRKYTSVHCYADDLPLQKGKDDGPASPQPLSKGKGGRKPIVDWGVVFAEFERLMDHHNEFSPDDPEWNAQARLIEGLQKFCCDKFGIEPDKNTIGGRIKGPLAQWREQKAKHPKT